MHSFSNVARYIYVLFFALRLLTFVLFIFSIEVGEANVLFDLRCFVIFSLLMLWKSFEVFAGLNFYDDF